MTKRSNTGLVWFGVAIAACLWFVMFSPWTARMVNFWTMMTCSGLALTLYATLCGREWLKEIHFTWPQFANGVVIAVALWILFWLGDRFSRQLLPFARPQVEMIYAMKGGIHLWALSMLMLLVIGPAEEIFWRGFVQHRLMKRYGCNLGYVLATLCYALIHIWSFNFMLVMAAAVAGLCWGAVYRFFSHSLTALIVSHALWDVCIFVLFAI